MGSLRLVVNNAQRSLAALFPGFFHGAKHNHYADFGYPETLTFKQFFDMYARNGLARAGVERTILTTWQDAPWLLEKERDGSQGAVKDETKLEKEVRLRFTTLRLWQHLAEADRRSLVGGYAGVILRLADNKSFDQPVERVPGGLDGLVETIPAWEGQLTVSSWEDDQKSERYGQPKLFGFNEAAVDAGRSQPRSFNIHPDRVVVWSKDGTVHARSLLEPGFNDLMTLEKISGAGGEGFWKNAKSAPVLEVDAEANIGAMAEAMGVKPEEIADKMAAQVEGWNKGFDKLLMMQGIQAKTLGITLPSPEHFFAIAMQSYAASIPIPLKILVGSQSGERASTEDASEWARTIMSRRTNQIVPNTMEMVERLVRFGILPEKDWHLDWSDLTEASMADKIDRANKMADVNQKMKDTGEFIFTPEEIRAAVDLEPLSDAEKLRDEPEDADPIGAMPGEPEPKA
jgi:hypothetical protein